MLIFNYAWFIHVLQELNKIISNLNNRNNAPMYKSRLQPKKQRLREVGPTKVGQTQVLQPTSSLADQRYKYPLRTSAEPGWSKYRQSVGSISGGRGSGGRRFHRQNFFQKKTSASAQNFGKSVWDFPIV